jgi:hypothetical protein
MSSFSNLKDVSICQEYTRGAQRRQGAMTTAGNSHARRALVDGAWASRYPAQVSRHLQLRLETQPKTIQDIRWKAHLRRCQRDRRLVSRGQHAHVVTVAIARELAGFMWAMAREVPITLSGQRPARPDPFMQKVCQRASAKTQPRCGGHPRRREEAGTRRRVPRQRQAPDGGPQGGMKPTESRRITRRVFLAPPFPRHRGEKTS